MTQSAIKLGDDPQTSAVRNKRPSLRARIHPMIAEFLKDEARLFHLVEAFGSPLNVMFPQIIAENIASFKDVYKRHRISGQIYYTSKPNKSSAVMREAALHDVNIDVSSEEALKVAIGCGFHPSRIEVTGPKNLDYLSLAIQLDVTVNADNFTELQQVLDVRRALGIKNKTRIFVRLGGFRSQRVAFTKQDNTFGISPADSAAIFAFLLENQNELDFRGFSYYWSGATTEQRVVALETALELTLAALQQGLKPKGLNIGGGFHVQYADDRQEWNDYVAAVKQSMLGEHISMTWNDSGLGFRNVNGLITGAPNFMDHFMPVSGAEDLYQLLEQPLPAFDGMTAAQILSDSLLDLYIEPGRAMLDQVGITVGRVNYNKESTNGETLVALDMNRSNVHSTHQKLLTEPVVIYRDKSKRLKNDKGVMYIGNLCVSYDLVQYNKTFPELTPDTGDLVVFINTGPYIMDFIESNTLYQSVAKKVAIYRSDNALQWTTDEKYKPAIIKLEN